MSFIKGKKLAEEFLRENSLPLPSILETSMICVDHNYGEYREGSIVVNSKACWGPVGRMKDYSIIGVIMHEVGHHVYHVTGKKDGLLRMLSYSRSETVAETIRLFVLNPNLLPEENLYYCKDILCLETTSLSSILDTH